MRHNPGFYFELAPFDSALSNPEKPAKFPSLEEFGPTAIYNSSRDYFWYYFLPEDRSPLDAYILNDNDSRVVLFYGHIYSTHSADQISNRLINSDFISLPTILREISGVFAGLIFDKYSKTLCLFVDQFGVKKVFYGILDRKLVVSSHAMLISSHNNMHSIADSAFASILFSGHLISGSLFDDIKQVNAGCAIQYQDGLFAEKEYVTYPERVKESLQDSIERVKHAHLDFWQRMRAKGVDSKIALMLSRGKDARVCLKYMLDTGFSPNLISFYREEDEMLPFVSFLLKAKDDLVAASQIAKIIGVPLLSHRIPNAFLLENMKRLITLNHGTPLHWEFLAAAEVVQEKADYSVTGFVGDVLSGKSHHHYHFKNVSSVSDYAKLEFRNAGDPNSYSLIKEAIQNTIGRDVLPIRANFSLWKQAYQICESEDLDIVFQQGYFRTRGLGRTGPTFDQMRLFTIPIYPYNDNLIIDAYRTIPTKNLIWEKAHVGQLAKDSRFNSVNSTRFPFSLRNELKYIDLLGFLRKIDTFRKHIKRNRACYSVLKENALRVTLADYGVGSSFWKAIDHAPRTPGFYNTLSNFISALRIQEALKSKGISCIARELILYKEYENSNGC